MSAWRQKLTFDCDQKTIFAVCDMASRGANAALLRQTLEGEQYFASVAESCALPREFLSSRSMVTISLPNDALARFCTCLRRAGWQQSGDVPRGEQVLAGQKSEATHS